MMDYIYITSPIIAMERIQTLSDNFGILILIALFIFFKLLSLMAKDINAIKGKLSKTQINSLWISLSLLLIVITLIYLAITKGLILFPKFIGYLDLSAELIIIMILYGAVSFIIATVRAFYSGLKGDEEETNVKKGGIITSIILVIFVSIGLFVYSSYTETVEKLNENNQTLST